MGLADQFQQQGQLKSAVSMVRGMMGGDPWATVNALAQSDPQIAAIVNKYRAMSPSEAFGSIGYDLSEIQRLIGS